MNQMDFEEVWNRIKEVTNLKQYQELADLVEVTKSNISNRKTGKNFPIEWAFKIARKYGLSTDWIMTGDGPIKPGEGSSDPKVIKEISRWIQEQEKKEPGTLTWFTFDFRKKYPEFDRWEKREEDSSSERNDGIKKNIA